MMIALVFLRVELVMMIALVFCQIIDDSLWTKRKETGQIVADVVANMICKRRQKR